MGGKTSGSSIAQNTFWRWGVYLFFGFFLHLLIAIVIAIQLFGIQISDNLWLPTCLAFIIFLVIDGLYLVLMIGGLIMDAMSNSKIKEIRLRMNHHWLSIIAILIMGIIIIVFINDENSRLCDEPATWLKIEQGGKNFVAQWIFTDNTATLRSVLLWGILVGELISVILLFVTDIGVYSVGSDVFAEII